MPGLCQYSGLLGEPGRGAHSARVGGLAAVDLLLTAGLALLVATRRPRGSRVAWFVLLVLVLILIGIAAHEAFCVNTRLNAWLFGRDWPGPPSLPAAY